jgi:hypothetical protein
MIWQIGGALAWSRTRPSWVAWPQADPNPLHATDGMAPGRLLGDGVRAADRPCRACPQVAVIVCCCPLEHAPGDPAGALVTALVPPVLEGEAGAPVPVESLPGRRAAGGMDGASGRLCGNGEPAACGPGHSAGCATPPWPTTACSSPPGVSARRPPRRVTLPERRARTAVSAAAPLGRDPWPMSWRPSSSPSSSCCSRGSWSRPGDRGMVPVRGGGGRPRPPTPDRLRAAAAGGRARPGPATAQARQELPRDHHLPRRARS